MVSSPRKILVENRDHRRHSSRFRTAFERLYCSAQLESAGVLAGTYYQGARLENASIRPVLGDHAGLYVFVRPVDPFELLGSVVRHTNDGFAVEFDKLDPDTQSVVDDVAAIFSVPRGSDRPAGRLLRPGGSSDPSRVRRRRELQRTQRR